MEQARLLGESSQWGMNPARFWRIYSSDLPRAEQTTQILLASLWSRTSQAFQHQHSPVTVTPPADEDDANTILVSSVASSSLPKIVQQVRLDGRLRELAKGARQGLSKDLSYDDAVLMRQHKISTGEWPAGPVPLLETEEDGWSRAVDWLNELISDALQQTRDVGENGRVLNVLVVSHAGFLRGFLSRLVGAGRLRAHPDATYDPIDGRFAVPNTSLTILTLSCSNNPGGETNEGPIDDIPAIGSVDVTLLTSTEHYQDIMQNETIVR